MYRSSPEPEAPADYTVRHLEKIVEKSLLVPGRTRVRFLNIPLDLIPEEYLPEAVSAMLAEPKVHHIVLVTLWDLMRARRSREYRTMLEQAALVLPISRGIRMGVEFLGKGSPVRYFPFDFVIRILGILEERRRSTYLLGGSVETVQISERNIRQTFPGLKVVGRYAGSYPRAMEKNILLAVRKASPSLLLVGRGLSGGNRWIHRNRQQLPQGIVFWCDDCFEIFAEKKKRVGRKQFQMGWEFLPGLVRKPWRLFRGIVYLYYLLLLLIHRIRRF